MYAPDIGHFILVITLAFMSSSALRKLPRPSRFNVLSDSSVWTEFSSLGRETGAINLAQVKSSTSFSCGICGSPVVIFGMLFVYSV